MGVIAEIPVLLLRRLFAYRKTLTDCCHDSSGQLAFVFHGDCWASLLVVVAIMCSWHCSLFLQMVTVVLWVASQVKSCHIHMSKSGPGTDFCETLGCHS